MDLPLTEEEKLVMWTLFVSSRPLDHETNSKEFYSKLQEIGKFDEPTIGDNLKNEARQIVKAFKENYKEYELRLLKHKAER